MCKNYTKCTSAVISNKDKNKKNYLSYLCYLSICSYTTTELIFKSISKNIQSLGQEACALTFLLWEMLRAPKSLNSEDVCEFTGSVEDQSVGLEQCYFQYTVDEC